MKTFLAAVLILAIPVLIGSCAVAVWKDCRKDHGVLYCVHVLGAK